MGGLQIEVDPAEVGFDQARLDRIDKHFARYVDERKLAGWLITVARHGKLAHVSTLRAAGHRGRAAGGAGHPVADLLHDQADHLGRGDDALRGGRLPADRSGLQVHPVVPRRPGVRRRQRRQLQDGAGHRADPDLAPAQPHLGADLRLHAQPPGRRDLPGPRASSGARRAAPTWPPCCDEFASMPLLFQPGSEWSYSVATDVLGRVVEVVSGQRLDEFFASRIFGPLGMTDTAFFAGPDEAAAAGRALHAQPGGRQGHPDGRDGQCGAARAGLPERRRRPVSSPPATTTGSPRCCCTGRTARPANWTACGCSARARSPTWRATTCPATPTWRRSAGRCTRRRCSPASASALASPCVIDPLATKSLGSAGEFNWGGAASTTFWVDPAEQVTATFFTQLLPSSAYPIRPQLRQMVYQALVD